MTLYENDACFASKPGQAVKDLESIRQSFQSFIDMGVKLEAKHKLIMKVSQDEQKQENDNVNILAKIKTTLELLAPKVNTIQLNHCLWS